LILLRQDGTSRQGSEDEEEESADSIRVMTVHASKGLEFPIVYMPGLVERRFPLQARSSPVSVPQGMLSEESMGINAHNSGEACLFYVGITRARDQLVLSYSERYGKVKYKRSLYLDALEAGLPTERLHILHWEQKTQRFSPLKRQREYHLNRRRFYQEKEKRRAESGIRLKPISAARDNMLIQTSTVLVAPATASALLASYPAHPG